MLIAFDVGDMIFLRTSLDVKGSECGMVCKMALGCFIRIHTLPLRQHPDTERALNHHKMPPNTQQVLGAYRRQHMPSSKEHRHLYEPYRPQLHAMRLLKRL